jgi:hypothetical protein
MESSLAMSCTFVGYDKIILEGRALIGTQLLRKRTSYIPTQLFIYERI